MRALDLVGQRFGRVVVHSVTTVRGSRGWRCVCDCGKETKAKASELRRGQIKSCGCGKATHGLHHGFVGTREYVTWKNMVARCTNPKVKGWKWYGARGITVCKRWLKFENFFADMGAKPPRLTIERKNNNRGYYKRNCCWATHKQQRANQRKVAR